MHNVNIISTADIHFERLEQEDLDKIIEYYINTLKNNKVDILLFAGDTCDNRNLKVESKEYHNLCYFLKIISDYTSNHNIAFVILKGTPSHDGNIIQNIISTNLNNIIYIDTVTIRMIKDVNILFIPELYLPKYSDFLNIINQYTRKFDIIIFHGMVDFAIKQLKQIDSTRNLNRSIIMKSEDLIPKAHLIVGGHVHKSFNYKNIYYLGRFINEKGHMEDEQDVFGLKYIRFNIKTKHYSIENIDSHINYKNDVIYLDFINNELQEIIYLSKKNNIDNTIFYCKLNNDELIKNKFIAFKELIKPKYLKTKFINKNNDDTVYTDSVLRFVGTNDLITMLSDIYLEKNNKPIPIEILTKIKDNTEED